MDFPIEEYQRRLSVLQASMDRAKLPAILIHQPENIRYLSGFFTIGYFFYHALLVPANADPILIVRDMEVPAAEKSSWVKHWAIWQDNKDPLAVAAKAVGEALDMAGLTSARIGVDHQSWFLTPERLNYLAKALPSVDFVAEPHLVETLRIIKSPREIETHRRAARVVESAMQAGIDTISTGVAENKIAASVYAAIMNSGGDSPVEGVITSGDRTNEIHGSASAREIQAGDQVYFELTASVDWYVTRLMRTAVYGKATDEQQHAAETIIKVQDAGIAMMQPGVCAGDVDAYCRNALLKSGIRDSYTNRTSYAIGLVFHPSAGEYNRDVVPGVEWTYEPGMVQHVLMMGNGMGFSETVLITENGSELITNFNRQLIEKT